MRKVKKNVPEKQTNNEPTRIAHIIGKMWAGGVESVVFNYYKAIDHDKYQFDFYYDADSTVEPPSELISMGARFIKLPPYQKLPQYINCLRRYLRAEKYAIVHSHLNTLSVFPLYCAWREGIPIRIAHNHSVPGGYETGRNAMKGFLRFFSRTFSNEYCACSEIAGRWLFGDKLFEKGEITIIKNAIDYSLFSITEPITAIKRKTLQLQESNFVVGHVGRFTTAKNHKKVLSVFKAIKTKKDNAVLLLVGDGEERENIEGWIEEYGMTGSVVMTGKVSDPQSYYPLINVLMLPSIFEGVPVTIIEAQVAGVPCVLSTIVNKDVTISNGCIFLDVNDSDEKWADSVIKADSIHVELNKKSINYDINSAVKVLEEKYDKLLRR